LAATDVRSADSQGLTITKWTTNMPSIFPVKCEAHDADEQGTRPRFSGNAGSLTCGRALEIHP